MRYVVLVLAVLGAVSSGLLGYKWASDYYKNKDQVEAAHKLGAIMGKAAEMDKAYADYQRLAIGFAFLLAGFPLGIAGGVLALRAKRLLAALLMLIPVVGAAVIKPGTLIFTSPLVLAAILCFFVRPRPPFEPAAAGPVGSRAPLR